MPVKRKLAAPDAPARPPKSLSVRDFLALTDDAIRARLGRGATRFETRQRFGYVQYWRGESWLHYEIWAQRKTQRVEIGLHFEGGRARSYAAAAALAARMDDVIAAIGPGYELEEWTPAWTRLHRTLHAPALTPDLAAEAADHAASLITGMEPLIAELGLR